MPSRSGRILALLISFAAPTVTPAAEWSVEQAVRYALSHHPQLVASQAQSEAAVARRRMAQAGHLPSLDVSYVARRSNDPLDAFADKLNTRSVDPAVDFSADALNQPENSDMRMTRLELQMPVYAGGRVSAAVRSGEYIEQAAELGYERTRQAIAWQAWRAYVAAQAGEQAVLISADAVTAAQQHAVTTTRLVREGRIVTSDKLTAEVNLAAVRSAFELAQSRRAQNYAGLMEILGYEETDPLQVAPLSGDRKASFNLAPLEDYQQQALTQRADLKALEAQHASSLSQVDGARAQFLPKVNVIAHQNWYDSGTERDESWRVMGVVKLNLFAGDQHRQQLAERRLSAREAQSAVAALRLQIRREVTSAFSVLTASRARQQIALNNVDKARRSVDLIRQRYGQGRTILIDLLQAEQSLVMARQEALNAEHDFDRAIADLNWAVGVPVDKQMSSQR